MYTLVIQPSETYPPDQLGEWLTAAGAEFDLLDPERRAVPDDLAEYDALVVLGGEMGAMDDSRYPWLTRVRALLSRAVSRDQPILAIGLGAQLLALATGGRVKSARNGPESGTLLIAKRDVAAEDRLLGAIPLTPDVLQFHSDEVSTLPPSGQLLASSPKCENQAFRVGTCAYGIQFHIETTTSTVLRWVERFPELADSARSGHWDAGHLDSFHADMLETWQPMVDEFVRIASAPPDERRTTRTLPIV